MRDEFFRIYLVPAKLAIFTDFRDGRSGKRNRLRTRMRAFISPVYIFIFYFIIYVKIFHFLKCNFFTFR